MTRRLVRWAALPALGLALSAAQARAEVHRHTDPASGMEVLSNVAPPTPAPVTLAATPAPARAGARGAAAAASFPIIGRDHQNALDAERRAILQDELLSEQKMLRQARDMRAGADVLHRHRMNVEALTRELAGVR